MDLGATTSVKVRPGAVWALALVIFVDAIGIGILMPMFAFFTQHLGATPAVVTQLVAVHAFASILGAPFMGAMGDKVPRKLIIVLAMFGLAIGYAGLALATSLAVVFAFRALSGFMAGNEAVAQALVIEGEPEERHTRLLGLIGASRGLGMVLGPLLGSAGAIYIADPTVYYRATIWGAAALSTLAMMIALALVREDSGRRRPAALAREKAALPREIAAAVFQALAITAALSFGFGVLLAVTPLFVQRTYGWGAAETGGLLFLCAALTVASRIFLADWLERITGGPAGALAAATLGGFVAAIAMALSPPGWLFPVWVGVLCTAYAVGLVLTASRLASLAPLEHRGAYLGWNQAVFGFAVVVSASVSGLLFEKLWPGGPFAAVALVLAAPTLLALAAWASLMKVSQHKG